MTKLTKVDCKKRIIRTEWKPLKLSGWCKVFLVFEGRVPATSGPHTRSVEAKLLSNSMQRNRKLLTNKNRTDEQRNASEANRKAQFNKEIEVRTPLISIKQGNSWQQPSNSSLISIFCTKTKQYQPPQIQCYKKFQDLGEVVKTKLRLGYKIINDSNRSKNLISSTSGLFIFYRKECPSRLSVETKFHPTQETFKNKLIQTVNESKSNSNHPKDNPVAQTVQNERTASGQDTEKIFRKHLRRSRDVNADKEIRHRIQNRRDQGFGQRRRELEKEIDIERESSKQSINYWK